MHLSWLRSSFSGMTLGISVLMQASCGMYQLYPGRSPQVLGAGSVEEQPTTEGKLYRVTIPGLGIRSSYLGNGFSLGWHESLVFCVEMDKPNHPIDCIADQVSSLGLDASGGGLMLGYYRGFRVPLPDQQTAVMQSIYFSEQQPGKAQIIRRQF